jgi:hypothetical protein
MEDIGGWKILGDGGRGLDLSVTVQAVHAIQVTPTNTRTRRDQPTAQPYQETAELVDTTDCDKGPALPVLCRNHTLFLFSDSRHTSLTIKPYRPSATYPCIFCMLAWGWRVKEHVQRAAQTCGVLPYEYRCTTRWFVQGGLYRRT